MHFLKQVMVKWRRSQREIRLPRCRVVLDDWRQVWGRWYWLLTGNDHGEAIAFASHAGAASWLCIQRASCQDRPPSPEGSKGPGMRDEGELREICPPSPLDQLGPRSNAAPTGSDHAMQARRSTTSTPTGRRDDISP
uniref:Uncharacterized protein n=1 Tax=Arundo donax TaxID=35708 RepID=A0A0A8XMT4_ARUDO